MVITTENAIIYQGKNDIEDMHDILRKLCLSIFKHPSKD